MALIVGRFSSLLVLLVVGMLPSTTCQSTSHGDEHDHDHENEHTMVTTTVDSHADHDHDHENEHTMVTTTVDSHADHDHDQENEHIMVTTTVDSHAGHDHDDHEHEHEHADAMNKTDGTDAKGTPASGKPASGTPAQKNVSSHAGHDHDDDHEHKHEHADAMNKTDGTDAMNKSKGTPASGTPAQKNVISGDFEVAVAEDQESKLKDAKVIVAFQKAFALFVNVSDTAVTVTWAEDVDHSGHDHDRRLRSLQATHHQVGNYEIKTDGLSNSAVQTAVDKLKRVKTSNSAANELKTKMNSRIQAVPGMTSLVVQKVTADKDPVLQQEATQTTPTEQNADFAKQTSCPWMHYSWLLVALFMKALI